MARSWEAALTLLRPTPSTLGLAPSGTPQTGTPYSAFAAGRADSGASAGGTGAGAAAVVRAAGAPLSLPNRPMPPLAPGVPGEAWGAQAGAAGARAGGHDGSTTPAYAAATGYGTRSSAEPRGHGLGPVPSGSGFPPLQTWMEIDGEGLALEVAASGALSESQLQLAHSQGEQCVQGQGGEQGNASGSAHPLHEGGAGDGGSTDGRGSVGVVGGGRGTASAPSLHAQSPPSVAAAGGSMTVEEGEALVASVAAPEHVVAGAQVDVVALRTGLFK